MKKKTKREEFSDLAREHHRELLVYSRALTRDAHTSRDLIQESFVVAWTNWGRFDVTRDFGAWMRGIVRNKWREILRKKGKEANFDEEVLEQIEATMRSWDELRQGQSANIFTKLEACLERLPANLGQAIKAFYYDGHNTEETANMLQIAGAALRKRLERARTMLRQCLGKQEAKIEL